MTEVSGAASPTLSGRARPSASGMIRSTEVDTRLLGMVAALAIIWLGFNLASGGLFLTPRNLWNLSVQSATVAIMATGMVLIIVSRNIDLSVGSILGLTGYVMAMTQAVWLPTTLGMGFDQPTTWIITLAVGLGLGAAIGLFHGVLIAYVAIPSFIVTLGGLLVWRGLIFLINQGQTISPLDPVFQLMGGGPRGSIGFAPSWILALIGCAFVVYALVQNRRRRRRYDFPLRPMWAEVLVGGAVCVAILGAVFVANSYPWPAALASQYAVENGIAEPPGGLIIPTGIANPVLLALGVAIVMTILATRRRFGRYVFAIGGNPEAAELGGINTRRTVMFTFVLMGLLSALAGAVQTARLNSAVTSLGTSNELDVIAAAVIGGTSFAGGIGTIPGAILGAVVMQSLRSGMVLLGFDSPVQDIVAGAVLVLAVGLDTIVRRRAS